MRICVVLDSSTLFLNVTQLGISTFVSGSASAATLEGVVGRSLWLCRMLARHLSCIASATLLTAGHLRRARLREAHSLVTSRQYVLLDAFAWRTPPPAPTLPHDSHSLAGAETTHASAVHLFSSCTRLPSRPHLTGPSNAYAPTPIASLYKRGSNGRAAELGGAASSSELLNETLARRVASVRPPDACRPTSLAPQPPQDTHGTAGSQPWRRGLHSLLILSRRLRRPTRSPPPPVAAPATR